MSYLWHFYSFDKNAFDSIVGSGSEDAKNAMSSAVTWDDWTEDMGKIGSLASSLAERGILYEGLDEKDRDLLDGIIGMIFSPEGLEEQLQITPESPEGVHSSTVNALLSRLKSPDHLRLLIHGRRYTTEDRTGDYLILSPGELKALLDEICAAYQSEVPWENDDHKMVTKTCLIDVLENIVRKNIFCYARQG